MLNGSRLPTDDLSLSKNNFPAVLENLGLVCAITGMYSRLRPFASARVAIPSANTIQDQRVKHHNISANIYIAMKLSRASVSHV